MSGGDKCGICYGDLIDDPASFWDGCCNWCGASSWWREGVGCDSRVIRELRGYLIHAREGKLPGQLRSVGEENNQP